MEQSAEADVAAGLLGKLKLAADGHGQARDDAGMALAELLAGLDQLHEAFGEVEKDVVGVAGRRLVGIMAGQEEDVVLEDAMMAAGGGESLELPRVDELLQGGEADVKHLRRLLRCEERVFVIWDHFKAIGVTI